jgi:hypothetical protein
MKNIRSILALVVVIFNLSFFHEAFAMKPGPFKDVAFTDPKSNITVTSILNKDRGYLSTNGVTTVFDPNKKELWHMNDFTGRHELQVSPEGKYLAFIGNFYFGGLMQPDKSERLVAIYDQGKKIKEVTLGDLFHEKASEIARSKAEAMMGGDWMGRKDVVKDIKIDWEHKKIGFTLYDDKLVEIVFSK